MDHSELAMWVISTCGVILFAMSTLEAIKRWRRTRAIKKYWKTHND